MDTTVYIVAKDLRAYNAIIDAYHLHSVPFARCDTVAAAVFAGLRDRDEHGTQEVMIWTVYGLLTPYRFLPDAGEGREAA